MEYDQSEHLFSLRPRRNNKNGIHPKRDECRLLASVVPPRLGQDRLTHLHDNGCMSRLCYYRLTIRLQNYLTIRPYSLCSSKVHSVLSSRAGFHRLCLLSVPTCNTYSSSSQPLQFRMIIRQGI